MQKSGKFSEISRKVTVKSIGNPGCSTTKRSILSTRGYNLFSEKKNIHVPAANRTSFSWKVSICTMVNLGPYIPVSLFY